MIKPPHLKKREPRNLTWKSKTLITQIITKEFPPQRHIFCGPWYPFCYYYNVQTTKEKQQEEVEEIFKDKGGFSGWTCLMELFPAQPDLSLQISPPNNKPTSSWRRSTEEEVDLGFWKRAFDSRNSMSSMAKPDTCFELSLSNPRPSDHHSSLTNHNHHLQNGNGNLFHTFPQQNHYSHHQNQHQHQLHHQPLFQQPTQGLSPELGFLRPIRGIPVYQNPPPFPFAQQPLDVSHQPSSISIPNTTSSSSPYQSQGLLRSRFLSRFPAKRSMRAPRMRWTTTLHARFVHAVELLGGHESKQLHLTLS